MEILEEKKYKIRTDKNNEMDLFLRIYDDEELSIALFNKYPYKKYELKCNLEEFQKNKFFRIFDNVEEIMKELDNKIQKSTFIEDKNCIKIEIEIGLTIINEVLLIIEEKEKNKDEIINYLIEKNKELEKTIDELKNKLKDKINEKEKLQNENKLEKRNNEFKKNIAEEDYQILINLKLDEEEEKAKKEESKLQRK